MAEQTALSTVFRSADRTAETSATAIKNLLVEAGIDAEVYAEEGAEEGTWEVRVPSSQAANAADLVAQAGTLESDSVNTSAELDFVNIVTTDGALSEMEATSVQSLLDANGINCIVVGASTLPNLGFEIQVAKEDVERARQIIAEAREAGPAAAAEGAEQSGAGADASATGDQKGE